MVPVTGSWLPSLSAAGVPISEDAYSGDNIGGFFCTSSENAANWTRSYSKSAYIDILPPRPNLNIISGATVERIVFADALVSGNRVASGVQFSTGAGTAVQNVTANKEVILAGGAMGSPHLLMVSGVGPSDVLQAANVAVQAALPGVGQHLLDHLVCLLFSKRSLPFSSYLLLSFRLLVSRLRLKLILKGRYMPAVPTSLYASPLPCSLYPFSPHPALQKTPEFGSFINSGIAYINGTLLFGGSDSFASFINGIPSSSVAAATLAPSTDSTVIEGYKAIYDTTVNTTYPTTGLVEILLSINAANQIAVQAAGQQPLRCAFF
jgi:choline dehydrogenase